MASEAVEAAAQCRRGRQLREAIDERAETELGEQRGDGFVIEIADAAGIPIGRDRHLGIEPHELAGKERLLAAFDEFLAFGAGDFGGVLEQVVQRAVGFEQLLGGFGADAGDAGHVVDFVADQGLEVDDLVGRDAPLFAQVRRRRRPGFCECCKRRRDR